MQKLIAILTVCSLTFVVSLQAKEKAHQDAAKVQSQKPKNVQKQQLAPKHQQPLKAPKTHVEKVQKNKTISPEVTKEKIDTRKPQSELQTDNQLPRKNKLDKQTIEKIKAQHRDFRAEPDPAIASVKYDKNYEIKEAKNWNGPQYRVFRTYRPQWHDQGWWKSHYKRVSLIGGGWYYWDAGYWYPAWGYDEAASYYPYEGPVFAGNFDFAQVVADVQAVLAQAWYYTAKVDGLLGPLTRQALMKYQADHGLYPTGTVDEPTLASMGLT